MLIFPLDLPPFAGIPPSFSTATYVFTCFYNELYARNNAMETMNDAVKRQKWRLPASRSPAKWLCCRIKRSSLPQPIQARYVRLLLESSNQHVHANLPYYPSGHTTLKWRRINVDVTWSRHIDVDTTSFWCCVPAGIVQSRTYQQKSEPPSWCIKDAKKPLNRKSQQLSQLYKWRKLYQLSIKCIFPCRVGNILSWRQIMKHFLRSFSPVRWFKKDSRQFLVKECAQYWLTAWWTKPTQ